MPAATRALSNWTSPSSRGVAVGLTHSAGRLGAGAAAPIVALLISTLSHEPFPYKDIWDPLGQVFDAFGFDRCM